MQEFAKLSNLNKVLVRLTIIVLLYGYICRIAGLYFFWESKTIGWLLFFITIISILIQRLKTKKIANKKAVAEKIFIGLILFGLFCQSLIVIIMPQTDAYKSAKQFLITDRVISNEVGSVYDVFLKPVGAISTSSSSAGEIGQADLNFIVKGKNKFKDINLKLTKEIDTDWIIVETK